jgi:hypothetical protein
MTQKKTKVKGKRGRYRKNTAPKADNFGLKPKVAQIEMPEPELSGVTQMTRIYEPKPEVVQTTWRAPIAKIF